MKIRSSPSAKIANRLNKYFHGSIDDDFANNEPEFSGSDLENIIIDPKIENHNELWNIQN
jgi:hypothetical protein